MQKDNNIFSTAIQKTGNSINSNNNSFTFQSQSTPKIRSSIADNYKDLLKYTGKEKDKIKIEDFVLIIRDIDKDSIYSELNKLGITKEQFEQFYKMIQK